MSLAVAIARPFRVVEANAASWSSTWLSLLTGVAEPLLYLFGLGYGLGDLIDEVTITGAGGVPETVPYVVFVAPAMMATAAMNGALFEMTFNLFYKLKVVRKYDSVLTTPLSFGDIVVGEILWALTRSAIYSLFFLVVLIALGLTRSWLVLLTWPVCLLLGWAFGAIGATLTTAVKAWTDFDLVFIGFQPLFLASATFFPSDVYPSWFQPVLWISPLYHGVDLVRSLSLGVLGWDDALHLVVLVAVAVGFSLAASRRMEGLLLN